MKNPRKNLTQISLHTFQYSKILESPNKRYVMTSFGIRLNRGSRKIVSRKLLEIVRYCRSSYFPAYLAMKPPGMFLRIVAVVGLVHLAQGE